MVHHKEAVPSWEKLGKKADSVSMQRGVCDETADINVPNALTHAYEQQDKTHCG